MRKREWKWKGRWKKSLARLLTAAMVCALIPVTAVHAAYEVLVEPAYNIAAGNYIILGSPSGDMTLVAVLSSTNPMIADGMYTLQYTDGKIEGSFKEHFHGQDGFLPCGYTVIENGTDYGIMNNSGEMVVPFGKYLDMSSISSDGYVGAKDEDGKEYLLINLLQETEVRINNSGRITGSKEIGSYGNGLRCLYYTGSDNKVHYYFLKADGTNPFSTEYDFATPFNYGYALVKTVGGQVYDIIDATGATVGSLPPSGNIPSNAWRVGDNGMIAFTDENWQYGYVNLNGDIVIDLQYAGAQDFRNGYAVVWNNNSGCGMIDTNNDVVIPFGLYQDISGASENGLVWVRDQNNKIGVVKVTPGAAEDPNDVYLTLSDATLYVPYAEDIGKFAREKYGLDSITFQADTRLPSWLTLSADGQTLSGVPTAAGDYIFPLTVNSVDNGVTDTKELTVGLSVYPNSDVNVRDQSDEGYEITSPKPELYQNALKSHTFISEGEFSRFLDAYIDGQVLDKGTYTAEAGSTKITISAQTFSSLSTGGHTFAATFKENESGSIKVAAQNFSIGSVAPGSSSSSGDDDDDDTYFNLTIPSFDHGKVTCSPSNARYGSKVTLTVTPDTGYQLASISVVGLNGKQIKLTRNGSKYTFNIPGSPVKIDAVFSVLPEPVQPANSFSDVPADAWFSPAVAWVSQHGYMVGYGGGVFGPDDKLETSALVKVLSNLSGADLSQYDGIHNEDIPDGQWYTAAAAWAKAAGVLPEGTFHTGDAISRGDMALILVRYLQFLGIECPVPEVPVEFADADEMTAEQNAAFQILYNMDIFDGIGNGAMDPSGTTTRAQVAKLARSIYDCMAAAKP